MPVPDSVVRPLTVADAAACESLSLDRSWEVGEARWRLLLDIGRGWACLLPDGSLVGTTLLLEYENKVGVAAMVLVRTSASRRGIARMLMSTLLADAPAHTYLYATEMGRPLYEQLGFVTTEHLVQLAGRPHRAARAQGPWQLRAVGPSGLQPVVELDRACFGADRSAMLSRLARDSVRIIGAWQDSTLIGAGFASPVGRHMVLGPVIASDDSVVRPLLDALADAHERPVRLDVPSSRLAAMRWAQESGLAQHETVPLMVLGGGTLPGRREHIVAVASRGLG